ncbi:hypothetical protein VTK26DRAFT_229 [Humicola hyalothermophila]
MQPSPLQPRLAAFLATLRLLLLLSLALFRLGVATAAELREALPAFLEDVGFPSNPDVRNPDDPIYEPEFLLFDRSIIGRAPPGVTSLTNNEPMPMNVDKGTTQRFVFVPPGLSSREAEEDRLGVRAEHNSSQQQDTGAGATENEDAQDDEGPRLAARQTSRRVFISANTCEQPQPIDASKTTQDPPQLILFVSTSEENQSPGPSADPASQESIEFKEGAVMYNLTTNGEVYIGIHAPNVSDAFSGIYNVKIAASVNDYYFRYEEASDPGVFLVDSDYQGALMITHDLMKAPNPKLEAELMTTQPYVLFAHNKKDRTINGLKRSFCGLQNFAQIAATGDSRQTSTVRTSMTKRPPGNLLKQQFFFSGLNSSAEYTVILAKDEKSTSKRQVTETPGGTVFTETSFSTKSNNGNCALIVDLEFCNEVAYAVPSNPNFGDSTELARFYDNYAASMYANFNKSLAQIACEAPSSQRYSLVRTCDDCAAAYKDWLCTVTIPRCEDFSNEAPYLQPRAIGQPFPATGETLDADTLRALPNTTRYNSSRNPLIDEFIKPGPYKELLPCDFLCYKLVQSCPAALGFGCPLPDNIGFEGNYARHAENGNLTCNFPGSAHIPSMGGRGRAVDWSVMMMGVGFAVVGVLAV